MSEQRRIERLDEAIDALMSGRREGLAFADPELATLLVTAADLRDLPDPEFKQQLKAELIPPSKEETMNSAAALPVETEIPSINPYLVVDGAARLIEFLERAFDARLDVRVPTETGRVLHGQVFVGDSRIELADATEQWKSLRSAMHIYVDDADATYERALAAGATSLLPPTNQAYGDREGAVVDPFGNHWYIATRFEEVPEDEVMRRFASGEPVTLTRTSGVGPRPKGFRTITPGLRTPETARLLEFLESAFDAKVLSRTPGPEGTIMHAEIRIGDSIIEAGDPHGPWMPMDAFLHLYVDDVDAVYRRATELGARSLMEPKDQPYGERGGLIADPAGNLWFIATRT
jgi:PhnB protein